jgi:preprotein translocase subunit SecA
VEYQREGYQLFAAMMESIKEESVRLLFHAQITTTANADGGTDAQDGDGMPVLTAAGAAATAGAAAQSLRARSQTLTYTAPSEDGTVTQRREGAGEAPAATGSDDPSGRPEGNRAQRRQAKKRR